jgi:hypothetical protein
MPRGDPPGNLLQRNTESSAGPVRCGDQRVQARSVGASSRRRPGSTCRSVDPRSAASSRPSQPTRRPRGSASSARCSPPAGDEHSTRLVDRDYSPTIDYLRLLVENATSWAFAVCLREPASVAIAILRTGCGLAANQDRLRLRPLTALETRFPLPHPDQHAARGRRRKGAARPYGMGLRPTLPPPRRSRMEAGYGERVTRPEIRRRPAGKC